MPSKTSWPRLVKVTWNKLYFKPACLDENNKIYEWKLKKVLNDFKKKFQPIPVEQKKKKKKKGLNEISVISATSSTSTVYSLAKVSSSGDVEIPTCWAILMVVALICMLQHMYTYPNIPTLFKQIVNNDEKVWCLRALCSSSWNTRQPTVCHSGLGYVCNKNVWRALYDASTICTVTTSFGRTRSVTTLKKWNTVACNLLYFVCMFRRHICFLKT